MVGVGVIVGVSVWVAVLVIVAVGTGDGVVVADGTGVRVAVTTNVWVELRAICVWPSLEQLVNNISPRTTRGKSRNLYEDSTDFDGFDNCIILKPEVVRVSDLTKIGIHNCHCPILFIPFSCRMRKYSSVVIIWISYLIHPHWELVKKIYLSVKCFPWNFRS